MVNRTAFVRSKILVLVLACAWILLVGHRPDPRYYYDEFVRVRFPFTGVGTNAVPDSTG